VKATLETINQMHGDGSRGKQDGQKQLASLSFSEKVKILEKLRERSKKIAASRSKLAGALDKLR